MKSVFEMMRLDGRVALLTGAAGGLGLAIGEALIEAGANLALCDRDPAALEARMAALRPVGPGRMITVAGDLADPAHIDACVARTVDWFGRLDIVVHNAAYTGQSGVAGYAVPFAEQTLEAWNAAMSVNLTAAFVLAQRARAALEASGHGVILHVGSIYGEVGPDHRLYEGTSMGNPAAYAASKGGLIQLSRYLSTTMAPKVRVNCLSPGGIVRGQAEAFRTRYEARTPLGRMATEQDLKAAAAFLVSDASAYVTGQNLMVDGGWSAW